MTYKPRNTRVLALSVASLCLAMLGGCSEQAGSEGGMPPATQVTVQELQPRTLPLRFEYVGRLEASREIEIRPRVTGLIKQRNFREGTRVNAGQKLFTLDAAPFAARKQAAAAGLNEARARLVQTEREVKRLTPLAAAEAISQRELDDATSNRDLARAAVAVAEAELAQAQLELDYTTVDAPIAGRIGRALQVEGALVSPTSGALATLAQTDPIYVRFSISGNDRLEIDREIAAGKLFMPPADQTRVAIRLADGSEYAHSGTIDFRDYRTDAKTGAMDARASLPNPDDTLNPGQFVRVSVEGATLPDALAVPQRAVQENASGKFVYVAATGENGMHTAQQRPVEVGQWVDATEDGKDERLWVIQSGLQAGDQVIIEGTARIFFPGMPVQPQTAAEASQAAGAPAQAEHAAPAGAH